MAVPDKSATSTLAGDLVCPDPSAHEHVHQKRLQDQAAGAALYVTHPENATNVRDANFPLGPDNKLSSASAALSLKYAQAQDLPSFPSVGIDTSTSGLAAATLANKNKTSVEWWQPEISANAGKAAMLAKDYKMAPLWQPEASAAGSKAAILAHQGPGRDWWMPQASKEGQSAAVIAMRNKDHGPQQNDGRTEDRHQKALLAARHSVKGRKRSESTPTSLVSSPNAQNTGQNALTAAASADANRLGSDAMEASRVKNIRNVPREMYTEKPPVDIERREKAHQDALKASAISMAKQMYAVQRVDNNGNITINHGRTAAGAALDAQSTTSSQDVRQQAMQYLTLQDAAQKLAAERLARIEDHHEASAFRDYYGYPSQKRRSRLSIKNRNRRRASSEGTKVDSDDDEEHARRVRSQMSHFNTQVAQIDAKKREQDRQNLMAVAERKVQAQMDKLDQKVFDETGKMSPSMVDEWDAKARARAEAASRVRMDNHGKVNIGGGKYLDQSEINQIAAARIKPTLDEITETAERQRARDEEIRLDQEERKREAQKEKHRQNEVKAEQKRIKKEEKHDEKTKKQDDRQNSKMLRGAEKEKKGEWKRLLMRHEKRKSIGADSAEEEEQEEPVPTASGAVPIDSNRGESIERQETGTSSAAVVDMVAHNTGTPTAHADEARPVSPLAEDRTTEEGPSPTSPSRKRLSTFFSKLKRKPKDKKSEHGPEKSFTGGAAFTRASSGAPTRSDNIPQANAPESSPSISSLSSSDLDPPDSEERGRSKSRLSALSGGSDEFEEARDTFDDARAQPPTFSSKKTESPARDSRFHEAL